MQPVSRAEGKQHIWPALILKSLQLCEKAMLQQVTIRSLPNVCALMLQTCTKSRMQQKARTRESNLCQQKLAHLVWADCGPTTIYRQSQMPSSPWAFKVARQTQQVCCRPHAPPQSILSVLKPLCVKCDLHTHAHSPLVSAVHPAAGYHFRAGACCQSYYTVHAQMLFPHKLMQTLIHVMCVAAFYVCVAGVWCCRVAQVPSGRLCTQRL